MKVKFEALTAETKEQLEHVQSKFDEQEEILKHSRDEIARLKQQIRVEKKAPNNPLVGRASSVPRSCYEIFSLPQPNAGSGMYLIDPDGNGGDPPIYAYCDMSTGMTSIAHNNELPTRVDLSCSGQDCIEMEVTYNASVKQIRSLAYVSEQCRQKFEVNRTSLQQRHLIMQ